MRGWLLQEDPSWQVALRALYAVEAVLAQGATAACGEVAVHFQARPAATTPLRSHQCHMH